MAFAKGDEVILAGLSAAGMNGQVGILTDGPNAKGRWPVQLATNGKNVSIKNCFGAFHAGKRDDAQVLSLADLLAYRCESRIALQQPASGAASDSHRPHVVLQCTATHANETVGVGALEQYSCNESPNECECHGYECLPVLVQAGGGGHDRSAARAGAGLAETTTQYGGRRLRLLQPQRSCSLQVSTLIASTFQQHHQQLV